MRSTTAVRYGPAAGLCAESQLALPARARLIEERAGYGKGAAARRLLMTAEPARSGNYTSPSCIPPSAAHGGHASGAGDRWRRRRTARECLRPPGVQQLDLVDDRWPGWWNWSQGAPAQSSGRPAGAITVCSSPVATALPAVAAAADATVYERGDRSTVSEPRRPRPGPVPNRAFFQPAAAILRPGGVFATQSEIARGFRSVHLDGAAAARKWFRATLRSPLRLGCRM